MFHIIVIPKFTFTYLLKIIVFLFKKGSNISNYSVFSCFIFFFCLKKLILLLIMIFFSNCFSNFNLLSLFPFPYTIFHHNSQVYFWKRVATLSLKSPKVFLIVLGIQLINQSYQVFLKVFFLSSLFDLPVIYRHINRLKK